MDEFAYDSTQTYLAERMGLELLEAMLELADEAPVRDAFHLQLREASEHVRVYASLDDVVELYRIVERHAGVDDRDGDPRAVGVVPCFHRIDHLERPVLLEEWIVQGHQSLAEEVRLDVLDAKVAFEPRDDLGLSLRAHADAEDARVARFRAVQAKLDTPDFVFERLFVALARRVVEVDDQITSFGLGARAEHILRVGGRTARDREAKRKREAEREKARGTRGEAYEETIGALPRK